MRGIDVVKERRSVKYFDPNYVMSEAEIEKLLSLSLLSPTAFNIQNWRFLVIDDVGLRKALRDASGDQLQVTDSSLLVVICADLMAWNKSPDRYWRNAPQDVQQIMVPMISEFFENNTQLQRDEAMRSCGIAAQTLMLSAKAMGYDSCPMDGFDGDKVAEIIQLPDDHCISMFVAIGKALKPARERAGQLSYGEVVLRNRFG
ncbi:MAG: nitroreductase family protein [Gammaproteobacteria bacterium]|nr:nitroreductase family protein [Gammaproteobacteria bacterium]